MEIKKRLYLDMDKEGVIHLYGVADENLRLIEKELKVDIIGQNDRAVIKGDKENVEYAEQVLKRLKRRLEKGGGLNKVIVREIIDKVKRGIEDMEKKQTPAEEIKQVSNETGIMVSSKRGPVRPKTKTQENYLKRIFEDQIVFGIGPAGTGKTYLAAAAALYFLREKKIERIILVRPVVEAGEKLGFLPGNLQEKIDPYLRPIFDAFVDMIDPAVFQELIETEVIEVAPLAYMRGRTLNKAFIILDEAQNTTVDQMKMFLTRLGNEAKAVVTGDVTQSDLPAGKKSGLVSAQEIFSDIPGLSMVYFKNEDVTRAEIVKRILEAYEKYENG